MTFAHIKVKENKDESGKDYEGNWELEIIHQLARIADALEQANINK